MRLTRSSFACVSSDRRTVVLSRAASRLKLRGSPRTDATRLPPAFGRAVDDDPLWVPLVVPLVVVEVAGCERHAAPATKQLTRQTATSLRILPVKTPSRRLESWPCKLIDRFVKIHRAACVSERDPHSSRATRDRWPV